MRSFIAIDLTPEIKTAIADIQNKLKNLFKASWTNPTNLHITMKFLGNINEKEKEEIVDMISSINQKQFTAKIANLDAFPSRTKAKILFFQVESSYLLEIYDFLQNNLKRTKLAIDDKPFKSHITIARIKKPLNIEKFIKEIKLESSFRADEITLFESVLTPQGPIYKNIFAKYLPE